MARTDGLFAADSGFAAGDFLSIAGRCAGLGGVAFFTAAGLLTDLRGNAGAAATFLAAAFFATGLFAEASLAGGFRVPAFLPPASADLGGGLAFFAVFAGADLAAALSGCASGRASMSDAVGGAAS